MKKVAAATMIIAQISAHTSAFAESSSLTDHQLNTCIKPVIDALNIDVSNSKKYSRLSARLKAYEKLSVDAQRECYTKRIWRMWGISKNPSDTSNLKRMKKYVFKDFLEGHIPHGNPPLEVFGTQLVKVVNVCDDPNSTRKMCRKR